MLKHYLFVFVAFVCFLTVGCVPDGVSDAPTAEPATVTPMTSAADALPDLRVQDYHVQYDGCPWESAGSVTVRVVNDGAAVEGAFEVEINNGTVEIEGLAAGETNEGVVMFGSGPVGSVYAFADKTDLIDESDETNNEYQIFFTPPPPCPTEAAVVVPTSTPTVAPLPTVTMTPSP